MSCTPEGPDLDRPVQGAPAPHPIFGAWIDLLAPSAEERRAAERVVGVALPTHERRHEIEISSRLYAQDGALVMTVTIAAEDARAEHLDPLTLVLTNRHLVTIHDQAVPSIEAIRGRVHTRPATAAELFFELIEAVVDRLADRLERTNTQVASIAAEIFGEASNVRSLSAVYRTIRRLGGCGGPIYNVRDSLTTLERLTPFLTAHGNDVGLGPSQHERIATISADARSLAEHCEALNNRVTFLLDAILGLINIDQNRSMKVTSVMAALFLPPTLIASIYGMNFHVMPELSWRLGFAFSIGLMVMAATVVWLLLRWRNWL